jgi:hypothetical protein
MKHWMILVMMNELTMNYFSCQCCSICTATWTRSHATI